MRTENENKCVASACFTLNGYRKRKGKGFDVKPSDLLTLREFRAINEKPALAEWDDLAVFIPVDVAVRLYASLTPKARDLFVLNEVIGGWFGADDAQFDEAGRCVNADAVTCDIDGEFCSTPSHSEDVPSVEDYRDDLESCSQGGILFIYSTQY